MTATALPSWAPPDEHRPAPEPLLLVQAFLNTLDLDLGTDLLADASSALAWLTDADLIGPGATLTAHDLGLTRQVRAGIRALLSHNSGGPAPSAGDLQALSVVAEACLARLALDGSGQLRLLPQFPGRLEGGLVRLLLVIRDAQLDGTWQRLKICSNDDCRWSFYDRSRNRQGAWCDMASCGNRMKNRRFRARHR